MRYTLGHPLVDAALDDLRLGSAELKAFRVLWGQLDFEEFHWKKSDVLAAEIGVQRSYASTALRNLANLGYLEAGPRDEKGVGSYRLPRAVPGPGAGSTTSAIPRRERRIVRSSL